MKLLLRLSALLTLFIGFNLSAQTLESFSYLSSSTAAQLSVLSPKATYDVSYYKITYNTVGLNGLPTVASGAVAIPQNSGNSCNTFPLGAYCHGTVLRKSDVPSANYSESLIGKLLASTGYVCAMPDYLGLGDHPGLHPYLHAESEATTTIDALRAARELIDSLNITSGNNIQLVDSIVITGYSQGGHAAMAAFKYIQDNNLYTEFNVVGAAPASGPYNLSGSQADVLISDQPYSNPGYVFYLIMGLNEVYGNIYTNISEVFKSPYDTLIPPYFDGTFPMDSVNAKLPSKLSDFMEDTVLTAFKNDSVSKTHPIWQALLANDNFDWLPQRPLRMYYCTLDEQVDYRNALVAQDSMISNGATNVFAINRGNFNHSGCVFGSMLRAGNFMDSVSGGCSYDATLQIKESGLNPEVVLYPNPTQNQLQFTNLDPSVIYDITIYDFNGKTLNLGTYQTGQEYYINNLPNGVYHLKLNSKKTSKTFRFIKTL